MIDTILCIILAPTHVVNSIVEAVCQMISVFLMTGE